MEPLTLYAPAKVNLTLSVGDRRPDGYHDVSTVMQAVGLYDTLILTHGGAGLTLTCTDPAVPSDATNLVLRAAGKFFEETKLPVPDLHLHLRKRIPSQAGLGGGSSDAASTLLALRTLYAPSLPDVQLEHMAAALGSDVPFFIRGGTALARGRGEHLTPMPRLRDGWFVIVKPPEGFSTPAMYRRLDTHFVGIQNLGADFRYDEERGIYEITADRLQGSYMLLDEASVTGTANIVMAAVLAKGTTTIYNAACEPYVQQLCRLLNRMGAKISGIASNLLTIEGVEELHGTQHTVLPDMIEVGSFIGMAAMTKSEITIKNVSYENLGIIPESFRRLGIKLEQRGDDIYVPAQETYQIESFIDGSIMTIADATWPGLTPDLLSVMLVVATQAKGSVLIHQKMFESRLFFVDKLIDMGAQIILCDPHRAVVIGHNHGFKLRGARLTSPDIRAGIALLIAAMSAEGTSTISNIEQIDRGYQNIEGRLNAIGARITRI